MMRNKKIRFLYMFIAGIFISLLIHAVVPYPHDDHPRIYDFIITIIITFLVWEGNLRIDSYLNIRIPWVKNPMWRIAAQFPLSLAFSILAIYLPMLVYDQVICQSMLAKKNELKFSSVIIGILITFILLSVEIGSQFFIQWKKSLTEVEKYKAENLQAQLQNLKNQVNPHFLFNNLSVLSSLVQTNPDKAGEFIQQLSKVYRYLLDNDAGQLVPLDTELKFVQSYTFLLQIRFSDNLRVQYKLNEGTGKLLIPPMSLQMLIENAIKHNEVSALHPLSIDIEADQNRLLVSNPVKMRITHEPGTGKGLKNIRDRYAFFTHREITIKQHNGRFSVELPLLPAI